MLSRVSLIAEIVAVIETLDVDKQKRVLAVVTHLRDGGGQTAVLALPDDPDDPAQWDEWMGRWKNQAHEALATRRAQLEAAGLIDSKGAITTDRWPADMAPGSKSSVET